MKKLRLFSKEQSAISTENSLSKVEIAIVKYGNHSSIIAATEKMEKLDKPTFTSISLCMMKQWKRPEIQTVSQKTDIHVRIIKENYHNFNNSFSCSTFATGMKYTEITPIHKKDDKLTKKVIVQ